MPILGAHMSIAGGYYRSAEQAAAVQCDCVQLFTKNNNQWRAKPITEDDADRFRSTVSALGLQGTLSHASYLINLGSPKDELWEKSIDALTVEVKRATQLGIPHVVFHPGSFTTSSEAEGLTRICRALDKIHEETDPSGAMLLLENTAGQGSNLGWDFAQLGAILSGVKVPERIGICIDTCHAFAAGYELAEPEKYEVTMEKLNEAVGLEKVLAFHLNDSKGAFGSRKDRHEMIGEGEMGLEPFRNLLNDPRFQSIPMYLETPKGERAGKDHDAINLATLRDLVGDKH
ncbi:MAG: deoxyribonuclease IV [Planctomycetota bacterium]|nr:deoxyribonuclease IV [Planctomycetota bacterium]